MNGGPPNTLYPDNIVHPWFVLVIPISNPRDRSAPLLPVVNWTKRTLMAFLFSQMKNLKPIFINDIKRVENESPSVHLQSIHKHN